MTCSKVSKAEFEQKMDSTNGATTITKTESSSQNNNNNSSSNLISRRPKVSHAQVKTLKSAVNQALSWNEDDDTGIVICITTVCVRHYSYLDS